MYADKATRYQIVKNHFERAVTNAKVSEQLMERKRFNIFVNILTSGQLSYVVHNIVRYGMSRVTYVYAHRITIHTICT